MKWFALAGFLLCLPDAKLWRPLPAPAKLPTPAAQETGL